MNFSITVNFSAEELNEFVRQGLSMPDSIKMLKMILAKAESEAHPTVLVHGPTKRRDK